MQNCCNSFANALELLQSCTKLLIYLFLHDNHFTHLVLGKYQVPDEYEQINCTPSTTTVDDNQVKPIHWFCWITIMIMMDLCSFIVKI